MTARAQRSAPTYFTLKSWIKSSSTTLSIGPVAVAEPPGGEPLFTRMCSPPSCAAAWATILSTCSLLVTSVAMGMTRRPVSAANSCAASSSGPFERAQIATSAPSRASSSAMALPTPRLPPVTIATRPASSRSTAPPPLCGAESVDGRHQGRRSTKEIGHLDGLLDLRLRGSGAAGAVGDVGDAVRMRQERVDDHGHQELVLRGNGPVAQDAIALGHVRADELRIALLKGLDPRGQRHLCHVAPPRRRSERSPPHAQRSSLACGRRSGAMRH